MLGDKGITIFKNRMIFSVPLVLALTLTSAILIQTEPALWHSFNTNEYFSVSILILWFAFALISVFISVLSGRRKFAGSSPEEIADFIEKAGKYATDTSLRRSWRDVLEVHLKPKRVIIVIEKEGRRVYYTGKLKHIYTRDRAVLPSPPILTLKQFLSEKLGERFKVHD